MRDLRLRWKGSAGATPPRGSNDQAREPVKHKPQDVRHAVDDRPVCARNGDAGSEAVRGVVAGFDLAQRHDAAV